MHKALNTTDDGLCKAVSASGSCVAIRCFKMSKSFLLAWGGSDLPITNYH